MSNHIEPIVKNFLPNLQRVEPKARDSSATSVYKECPRKYFYRIVLGFQVKVPQPYFSFGTAYHKYRELLEIHTESGMDRDMAHASAAGAAMELHTDVAATGKWKYLTKTRLLEAIMVAYDYWKMEKKIGKIKVLGSEVDFAIVDDDTGMIVSGKIDQIISVNNRIWIRDFKTSSKIGPYYERGLEPNDQVTRYLWAVSKLTGKTPNGAYFEVLYQTEKEKPKIHTYTPTRTPYQLNTWLNEQRFWETQITRSRETDIWPMNERACAYCDFHLVCKSFNDAHIERNLKEHFKFDPWDSMNRSTDK